MSTGSVTKVLDATICDYCDKEIEYYSDTHARADITKVNDNPNNNSNKVDGKTKHVFWWRKKKVTFGTDSFDFHGDCFVEMMDMLQKIKDYKKTPKRTK